ncbi:ABC transporter permease, partial [bacterium]|nr:ABC transporter permease [bacterium]
MLGSYITIAFRTLARHKKYSIINFATLTLGLVPVILLLLYVHYEIGFDKYHEKADSIYRVVSESQRLGERFVTGVQRGALAPTMVDRLPEVVSATRLRRVGRAELQYGNKRFIERNFLYADPEIFEIFSFELLSGDPQKALAETESIVLSEEMVAKYFGEEEPLGKTLTFGARRLEVTGVLKRIPRQSHFLVDFLVPANLLGGVNLISTRAGILNSGSWTFIYFLLREDADADELEKEFPKFLEPYYSKLDLRQIRFFFQPLTDIHLYSRLHRELFPNGDIKLIYIYSSVALLILLISCISYVNLACVRSAERAREVGVRKVSGAQRSHLIKQFLGESTILTLLAVSVAIILTSLFLPYFNAFVEREIEPMTLLEGRFLLWTFCVIVLVGLCSGSYPALVLSAFKPVAVFRSKYGCAKPSRFRSTVAVIQFAFCTLFIVAALIVHQQLQFVQKKDLGYRQDQIVIVPIRERHVRTQLNVLKTELRRHPNIISVASSQYVPNRGWFARSYQKVSSNQGTVSIIFDNISVDYDFIKLFEMEIIDGRDFSRDFGTDASEALIVNETAVRSAGWKSALGQELVGYDDRKTGKVIGVVK